MYFLNQNEKLKGWATPEGTEKYYNMYQSSESKSMDVNHENFKSLFHNPMLKISSIGIGTYMGDPDDVTDF